MNLKGTSFIEKIIFYYLKNYFPDALNKYKLNANEKRIEVDIYIPSIRVAIEYDGSYWHKSKAKKDEEKNRILISENIDIIRIREQGLCNMEHLNGKCIILEKEDYTYFGPPYNYVKHSIDGILSYINKKENLNLTFSLTQKNYQKDLMNIYALFFNEKTELSHSQYCGVNYWNENNAILPENLPQDDWALAYLTCPNGKERILPRYRKRFRNSCGEQNVSCDKCIYSICPFLRECEKSSDFINCEYMKNMTWESIKKGISYSSFDGFYGYIGWLFNNTRYGIEIIEKFLMSPPKSKYRKNILRFLHLDKSSGSYTSYTTIPAWSKEDIETLKTFRVQLEGITIKIEDKSFEYEQKIYL